MLNTELVKQLRKEAGITVRELSAHLGLSPSLGYLMFRKGLLPEDRPRRREVLAKLAQRLGTTELQLLTPQEAKVRTA